MSNDSRYDRQLRLWEGTGQQSLEQAHVCLVNATSTGVEMLKNLVLPGIGNYTIIDEEPVTPASLGGNFFLHSEDIGSNRGEAVIKNLSPLNPNARGHYHNGNIYQGDKFWQQFTCVVVLDYACGIEQLRTQLWRLQIPLFLASTVGFYGTLVVQIPEVTVIDTHDPSKVMDLRIDSPWTELQAHVDAVDLDLLDEVEHAHVPYIVIFIKALQHWIKTQGQPPSNYAEKLQFQKQLVAMLRDLAIEGNFSEAREHYIRALHKTMVSLELQKLFTNPNALVTHRSLMFWVCIAALRRFIDEEGAVPLLGNLPDMVSDTKSYIALQKIYQNKARRDQSRFHEIVNDVLTSIGRKEAVSAASIRKFCQNARQLHVTVGTDKKYSETLISALFSPQSEGYLSTLNLLAVYFCKLAIDALHDKINMAPSIEHFDEILGEIQQMVTKPLPEQVSLTLRELLSHLSSNYHNLNAFMGGIVAQEVLKICVDQYVPLDNVYILDGVRLMASTWKI